MSLRAGQAEPRSFERTPATPLTSALTAPTRTLAFVESPVQLLNVLEWAHRDAARRIVPVLAGSGAGAVVSGSGVPVVPAPGGPPDPARGGREAAGARGSAPGPAAARVPSAREGGTTAAAAGGSTAVTGDGDGARAAGDPAAAVAAAGGTAGAGRPCAGPVTVIVLSPTDPMTRGQLRRMAELARDEGHHVRWEEARGASTAPLQTVRGLAPLLRAAERIVIGDPFSRYVQLLLTLTRARDLVVVDDGTATMEFIAQLARGERLVRWHRRGGRPGPRDLVFAPVSASARRRLTPGRRRTVEVFSSMPIEDAPDGVRITDNDFGWTRARFGPPHVLDGADLVGTSLVETGIVDLERYLEAVRALARAHGCARYFAHRREDTDKLRRLAAKTGLEIVRPDLPLELIARRGPIGRTILSFPSTVVHTLPLALVGTGVSVAVCDIDPAWLTAHASPRAEGFLAGVTGTARDVQRVGSGGPGADPGPGAGQDPEPGTASDASPASDSTVTASPASDSTVTAAPER